MKSFIYFILILLCFSPMTIYGEKYVSKIKDMPDFCQGDTRYGKLPNLGVSHCGPVAVSNALMWLSQNGFSNIYKSKYVGAQKQYDMILTISSSEYMKTQKKKGTQPKQIVSGLEKFVNNSGYGVEIETMGWRSKSKRIGKIPDINWMLNSVKNNSNLILNIGWYIYDNANNYYHRTNGHYVTVTGFDTDGDFPNFYVHDPANRDGLSKKTIVCTPKKLRRNAKLQLKSGKTISSEGFFELQGLKVKKGNDLAIIDGAIAFTVFTDN